MIRLWRRRNLIFGITLLFYVFLGMYVSLFPLEYKTTSVLGYFYNKQAADSAAKELLNDNFLITLAKTHKLDLYAEYNPAVKPPKPLFQFITSWQNPPDDMLPLDQLIIKRLRKHISIETSHLSDLRITVSSTSPKLAYFLANGLVEKVKSEKKNVELLENAKIPETASFVKYNNLIQVTGIIGVLVGLFFAYFVRPSGS